MDELLAKLDVVIREIESKRLVLDLGRAGGDLISLVTVLAEATTRLHGARALFKEAGALMQQGHGELVGPEE